MADDKNNSKTASAFTAAVGSELVAWMQKCSDDLVTEANQGEKRHRLSRQERAWAFRLVKRDFEENFMSQNTEGTQPSSA